MSERALISMPEREIEFRGRVMWVKFPTEGQLLVWRRVLRTIQDPESEKMDFQQSMDLLERCRKIIDSVLLEKQDRDWLDDQMLEGAITFESAIEIIHTAIKAFTPEASATPATLAGKAPAKKATRRKAATS